MSINVDQVELERLVSHHSCLSAYRFCPLSYSAYCAYSVTYEPLREADGTKRATKVILSRKAVSFYSTKNFKIKNKTNLLIYEFL